MRGAVEKEEIDMIVIGEEMVKEIIEVIQKCEPPDKETKERCKTIIDILTTWLSEMK